jgi:hypothetical protein
MSLQDTATAPVYRVASAGRQALGLAADLLAEAACTRGTDSQAEELQDAVSCACAAIAAIEDSDKGVADTVFIAGEVVRLCDLLAVRHRRSSPAALACAKLAEAAAELALEALTEDRPWTAVQVLSRRARHLVGIRDLRLKLDAMISAIEIDRVDGTPENQPIHQARANCS